MLHEYSQRNPRRPVNWRWERARTALEGGMPLSRNRDDAWVRKALQFRLADQQADGELDRLYLSDRMADIFWAHDIRFNGSLGFDGDVDRSNSLRSEVEARILSRESFDRIANRVATQADVIVAYEKLFFNVLDRLDQPGYIVHQVMTPAVFQGLHEREYDLIWKMVGYWCGPKVLDAMIYTFQNLPVPTRDEEVNGFIQETAKNSLRRKAMIACQILAVNPYTQTEIIDKFLKLHEIERASGNVGAGEQISQNVEVMLQALGQNFAIGRHADDTVDSPRLSHYDSQSTELTCAEIIEVTTSGELDGQKRLMLEQLHFPPPPRKQDFPKDEGQ